MSWLEVLEVKLAADAVRIARRGMLTRGGGAEHVQAVGESDRAKAGASEAWVGAVQCLARTLGALQRRGAAVDLVLSDQFSRYAMVPWNANLVSDAERIAFAAATFRQLFGAMADAWQVTLDEQPAGRSSFACAVDRGLIESARELCKANGLRLRSVQPLFAQRYNRHRQRITPPVCWVGSLESGRLTLALRDQAGWAGIRTVRLADGGSAELATVLRQEVAALGVPHGGPLFLMGREESLRAIASLSGWNIVRLPDGKNAALSTGNGATSMPATGASARDKIKEAS